MQDELLNYKSPFDKQEQDSDDKNRRAISMVRSFMQKSRKYREPHLDLAIKSREKYTNWDSSEPNRLRRANLKPSYGFTIVETLVPQITQIFLGDDHIVKFRGREREDITYEDTLTDFFDIQFTDMDFSAKFVAFIKNMLLDGTAIAKVPYRYQEIVGVERKTQQDPISGESFRTKEEVLKVVYDGPDFENVPIWDFFPDWQVKEPGMVTKMRGCVHRMYKTMADLNRTKAYKNLDELKLSMSTKGSEAWASPYWSDNHKDRAEELDSDRNKVKDNDKIEVWEYWGLFDATGRGDFKEYIITVANGDVVLRCDENFYDCKFKPFVACPNYVRANEFYGVPELSSVDSDIREATALRNARLDQINLGVNTMWLVDRAGGIDTKNLYSRPNGIIYTNDMNALKPIPGSEPSASSGQEINYLEQGIAQTTAIGAVPAGAGSSKSLARSATGVNYLSSFGNSRLDLRGLLIGELCIKPLVKIMMMTDAQFVTTEQMVRATDPNTPDPFQELPPDTFYRNYDYEIKTKQDLSDEQEFQKLQAVSQVVQAIEATQPGTFKIDILGEALLRPLIGSQVKKFTRSEEEMMQLKQQNMIMRLQEQQANAAIGASAPQPNANPNSSGGPLGGA